MLKPVRPLPVLDQDWKIVSNSEPDAEMHDAIKDPMNQAQTDAAGPPRLNGLPNVAGTDPKTPSTEMA
jgi:hypothetical protein